MIIVLDSSWPMDGSYCYFIYWPELLDWMRERNLWIDQKGTELDLDYLLRKGYACENCTRTSRHLSYHVDGYYVYHCDIHKSPTTIASLPDPPTPKVIIQTRTLPGPVVRVKNSNGVYGLPYNPNPSKNIGNFYYRDKLARKGTTL